MSFETSISIQKQQTEQRIDFVENGFMTFFLHVNNREDP